MGSLLQDARYGVRMLLKQPGFALIAVMALTLGANRGDILKLIVKQVEARFKEQGREAAGSLPRSAGIPNLGAQASLPALSVAGANICMSQHN